MAHAQLVPPQVLHLLLAPPGDHFAVPLKVGAAFAGLSSKSEGFNQRKWMNMWVDHAKDGGKIMFVELGIHRTLGIFDEWWDFMGAVW